MDNVTSESLMHVITEKFFPEFRVIYLVVPSFNKGTQFANIFIQVNNFQISKTVWTEFLGERFRH